MLMGQVKEAEEMTFIDGKCSNYEDVTIEPPEDLEPGEYIVFLEIDWPTG